MMDNDDDRLAPARGLIIAVFLGIILDVLLALLVIALVKFF